MNKRVLIVILVVVIAGAAVFGLTRNKKDNSATNSTTNSSSRTQTSNQTKTTPASSSSTVSIENFAFMPGDITVKKGTTVTWTNNDSTTHTVTEVDNQTGPKSGNLNNGDKYTFTFDKAGTFHYHCDIHSSMLGTVTVTE